MDPLYTVELFGGLRVVAHFDTLGDSVTKAVTRFRTHQTGSLLAYLASNAGRVLSREVVIDMLWPDACPKSGRSRLSMALSSLRCQIEPPGIPPGSVLTTDQHRIGLTRLVTTDTAEFEALISAAERPGMSRQDRKTLYEKAVRLFSSDLAPGHYDSWIIAEQERLADRARKAFLYLARTSESEGDIDVATAYARRAASDCEGLCDEAEDMLERLTSRARGIAAPGTARRVRPVDTGISGEFVEKTAAHHDAIARPTRVEIPLSAPLVDLAAQPVLPVPLTRFFGRSQELKALENAVTNPRIRLITLTGVGGSGKTRLIREAAIQWRGVSNLGLLELDPGPTELPNSTDILSLDFTTETDPFRLPVRVAAALDIPAADVNVFENIQEDTSFSVFVRAFTTRRSPVLILDNMEQLLPRAADWIEELLERVPHLTCVVTSRVRLRIPGEHEIPILPLPTPASIVFGQTNSQNGLDARSAAVPDSDSPLMLEKLIRDWPSVALFVDRAQEARPGFSLTMKNADDIVALVGHLEGLPLSIELAAARAQVMTPAHMLGQLRDNRFELLTSRGGAGTGRRRRAGRHTSLRETVAWSVSLLPEEIQTFYGQMSVFRGGWDDEAAEAVSDNPMALDALAVLCDASLVRTQSKIVDDDEVIRFDMLESLREFASTVLNDDMEDPVPDTSLESREIRVAVEAPAHPAYAEAAKRHFNFFADTVAQCAPHLQSADGKFYLAEIGRDNDNIKAALNWATAQNSADIARSALKMGGDLGPYWVRTGRLHEGRDLLESIVARKVRKTYRDLPKSSVAPGLSVVMNSLGIFAMQQHDYRGAIRRFRAAIFLENGKNTAELRLAAQDPRRTQFLRRQAAILNNVAITRKNLNDLPGAVRAYKGSLSLWREVGDMRFVGAVLSNIGAIAAKCGDSAGAEQYYREAITISKMSNNPHAEACAVNNLAELSLGLDLLSEADGLYRQSLRIFHAHNDFTNTAKIIFSLALIQVRYENTYQRGVRMLNVAQMVLADAGIALSRADEAAAAKLVGESWNQLSGNISDPRATLDGFITAMLNENRFASASLSQCRTVSSNL